MRDLDIRNALKKELASLHDEETIILDELGLCQGAARVDLAVVNGALHGYEIKSERDTLARLPTQQGIYNKVFDRVTLVISQSHVEKANQAVPNWWGIAIATQTEGHVSVRTVREATDNPLVDAFAQTQLLWREEALTALEERALAGGLRSKPKKVLWNRLVTELPPREIGTIVRECLRARAARPTAEPRE